MQNNKTGLSVGRSDRHFILTLIIGIILCLQLRVAGQDVYQSVVYSENIINASSQPEDSYGYRIFLTLAQDNVKNLGHVYFNLEGKVLIRHEETTEGQTVVYLKFVPDKIGGETKYRDFIIDSLLIPSSFTGNLKVVQQRGDTVNYPLEMLLSGGVVDLGGIKAKISADGQLEATIQVDRFLYSPRKYRDFMKGVNLINNYYAYNEVLSRLLKNYAKTGINRSQETSQLFLAWHEISRVKNYISTYHFKETLSLTQYDPLGFLLKYEKLKRLERRSATLRKMVLQAGKSKFLSQKEQFVLKYTGLSVTYSNLATHYQPYIATGFGQVVRLFPGTGDLEAIQREDEYYDVFNIPEQVSTPQMIYNQFIDLADLTYRNGKYVSALDFIYNAKVFEDYFKEIQRAPEFDKIYTKTLDGVLRSYLEVAIIAYRRGSYVMADRYYRKAEEAYDFYQNLKYGSRMPTDAFLMFIEEQVDLSYGLLESNKYYEAVKILDKASEISSTKKINTDSLSFDSAYAIGYRGIYSLKLDSLAMQIQNGMGGDALAGLNKVYNFSVNHNRYIGGNGNEKFLEMAGFFYDLYYDRGLMLMNSPKRDDALLALIEAQSINEKYLHKEVPGLDSLVDHATVPVMLDLTRKAAFEVWANRIDNAEAIYLKVLAMQAKYHQQDNPVVKEAIGDLRLRIDNRKCISLGNRCFSIKRQVENRINHYNYIEAQQLLKKVFGLIADNPDCDIDKSDFDLMDKKYKRVFNYLDMISSAGKSLVAASYEQAVEQYIRIEDYYVSNNLKNYSVDPVHLKDVVKSAGQTGFTIAACQYYLAQKDYKLSFYYLSLLRVQEIPPKNVKDLQLILGTVLAQHDSFRTAAPKTRVREYTCGEKWFRYFRTAYLQQ